MTCTPVPWIVWGFFKIITPFIDPVTREKLKFNEDMTQYVAPEQLWSGEWGGAMDFEYDHAVYWPAFNDMCRARREEKMRRWEAGGSVVGESEDYLMGGSDVSVKGITYEANGRDGTEEVQEKLAEVQIDGQTKEPAQDVEAVTGDDKNEVKPVTDNAELKPEDNDADKTEAKETAEKTD